MYDRDLKADDIQSLSNIDGITSFFTILGYETSGRIRQSPANLSITNESLIKEIKVIELIANQGGLLQVYLFELFSVTVANTQALAKIFRNRIGNYLLVLTSDYNRIDFALVERLLPGEKDEGIGTKQASIRPRVLTIDRLKPTRVDLRVLRRFSYTEADAIAQYEKLQAAYIIADWSEEFFNNRALFSDYYLIERLRDEAEWKENIKPAYSRFRELYHDARLTWQGKPESEFRKGFFDSIFDALGFRCEERKAADDEGRQPDYILHAGDSDKPLCLCLTYPWGRSLDGKDYTRDKDTPDENPGAVVVSLLEKGDAAWVIVTNGKHWRLYSSKAHSRATNYYEIDLEEVLARLDPEESFRYFYLFFRKEAFHVLDGITFLDKLLKGSEEYAKRLGERLKKRVFEEIFPYFAEGFISHLRKVKGVSEPPQDELDKIFHGTLTFLYRLLFILYAESRNLLPVRELRGYHKISLAALKVEIAHKLGDVFPDSADLFKKMPFDADSTSLYDGLQTLFRSIDSGDAAMNIPAYNGGLFMTSVPGDDDTQEAENARFLIENKMRHNFLAIGLDRLTRDEDDKTFKRVFIDYKSLGVRHLGSIYEGLLEFHLRIAPEKMAICEGKKTEEIIPYEEAIKQKKKILKMGRGKNAEERVLPKGTVYLENTKHERKATGSYYTPDYIVKYIVENTVGRVLKEKFVALTPKFREAQKAYREAVKRRDAIEKTGVKGDNPEKTAGSYSYLVDELFDVKVLDPAMGSGHFLVETVDFITDKMIDFLNGFPWNPIMATLRETRETILKAMETQSITIDESRLNDLSLLKRYVLKRCIYGVDLNPMAVELAKVSLWLDCFTLGAPLSFLDHHLKCGNSLIGATVQEVREAVEPEARISSKSKVAASGTEWRESEATVHQTILFGSRFAGLMLATDLMRHVGELSDVTAAQVKESRAEYRKASNTLGPFRRILDLYVSEWFGNDGGTKSKKRKVDASAALDFLKSREAEAFINTKDINALMGKLSVGDRKIAGTAINAAKEKRFFHWELEFPEVFYGKGREKENPGFDAVVGNPPYLSFATYPEVDKIFMDKHFNSATSKYDAYVLFIERAIRYARDNGLISFVVPNKFFRTDYGRGIRQLIAQSCSLKAVIDFKDLPVFEEATTYPAITVLLKGMRDMSLSYYCLVHSLPDISTNLLSEEHYDSQEIDHSLLTVEGWHFNNPGINLVLELCKSKSDFAKDHFSHIHQGIITGSDEPFFLSVADLTMFSAKSRNAIVRRLLKNRDMARWVVDDEEKYLLYPHRQCNSDACVIPERELKKDFPDVWDYLNRSDVKSKLLSREFLMKEISAGRRNTWYELWRSREPILFTKEQLLTPTLAASNRFSYLPSQSGFVFTGGAGGGYGLIRSDNKVNYNYKYYLAILNSKLLTFVYSCLCTEFSGGAYSYATQYLEKLPIRRIDFQISQVNRTSLLEQGRSLYKAYLTNQSSDNILSFIEQCLLGDPEESDVVHDLLACLAEHMIEMNRSRQKEAKRFFAWIEKALNVQFDNKGNAGIDALTGKSTIKSYMGDYQKNEDALSFDTLRARLSLFALK
ncbi:MAG: Eco57I restriction-modification methylase domain-containing protein [Dissulfurispiraceae bacterium]